MTSNPPPEQTIPPGDINPTLAKPGLKFLSMNPRINITFDHPAALALIYLPADRPNKPSNVNEFVVLFVYPNGTKSRPFTSRIPWPGRTDRTSTPPSGISLETSTIPSTTGVFPPSEASPQVDLPPNFRVPEGTKMMLVITSTTDRSYPTDVSVVFCAFVFFMCNS